MSNSSGRDQQFGSGDIFSGTTGRWILLCGGLAIGLFGSDLMIRRPLVQELRQVRSELALVERDMEALVGVRNQVWETSNLLTGLKAQYRQLEDARLSLKAVEQLQTDIQTGTQQIDAAFSRLDRLVSLQENLLRNTGSLDTAETSVSRLVALQDQVVAAADGNAAAAEAVQGLLNVRDAAAVEIASIDQALDSVRQFGQLKDQVLRHGEGLDVAQEHVAGLAAIKNDIFNQSANLDEARTAAQQLFALQQSLIEQGGNTETAFARTERLFALRDTLTSDMDLAGAERNLGQLVGLQNTLTAQTPDIADAVETLELLTDLSEELRQQAAAMGDMRKSLLDIVLMESTVRRVATILEPLSELGNLRRMNDADVREAARAVLDGRSSRYARRSDDQPRTASQSLTLDGVELFPNDPPRDILVPLPRDRQDEPRDEPRAAPEVETREE